MSILESDRKKSYGLRVDVPNHWTDQSTAVNPYTPLDSIDCKDYNTLQIVVTSREARAELEITGFYNDLTTSRYKVVPVINITDPTPIIISTGEFTVLAGAIRVFLVDVTKFNRVKIGKIGEAGIVNLSYSLDQTLKAFDMFNAAQMSSDASSNFEKLNAQLFNNGENHPISVTLSNPSDFEGTDFLKFFESDSVDMYIWDNVEASQLRATIHNNYAWSKDTVLYLSTTGVRGTKEVIPLNSTNFPNLLPDSIIAKVIMMPWERNAGANLYAKGWRMNVITSRGQIYHNFPNRSTNGDGTEQAGDFKRFDESCAWELPERWTPVKTTTGTDAALISTGKYRYFPALPDNSYEFLPAVNQDNGYGNGGFGSTNTKTNELGQQVIFGRLWRPNNSSEQDNMFDFMGGYAPSEKLTVLGTYRFNTTQGTRMCVFFTNDGGRNWYCRYEFGAHGHLMDAADAVFAGPSVQNFGPKLSLVGSAGSGQYQVRRRFQYTPSDVNKEPEKKFKHDSIFFNVASIVGTSEKIIVTTTEDSNIATGDIICFDKLTGNATWDWIVNTGYGDNSAGDGVYFKAKKINNTSFELMSSVHNPHNNLTCLHIHSANKNKDGYIIGTGEKYPLGWILYCPVLESDAWARKYPWDTLEFIRLTSTRESIQRPLGVQIMQDADNTVFIGVDNEKTDLGEIEMPEGRTVSFKRSSNGLFKGRLIDVDSQTLFECVLESPEVCYFFKEILGAFIYIGQLGHIAISFDKGKSWTQSRVPRFMKGELSHFGGTSYDKNIVIDNILLKMKK